MVRYGFDWPKEMNEVFIDLVVAKKWRLFKEQGVTFDVDPGDCLERALTTLWPDDIKINEWSSRMIHGFANEDLLDFIGCGSCGKSFTLAACGLAYWIVDPLNTAVIIGSATLKDLSARAWSPTLSLFTALKNNKQGFPIPGRIVNNAYAILNERDVNLPETMMAKSAVQGRDLSEGRLQGTHTEWVCLIVDELAIIQDIEALKTSITNIKIGTLGFKCVTAANPEGFEHPNSCFYVPPAGVTVDENTGQWRSAQGHLVIHFDGLKSPVVKDPKLKSVYPFLMSQANIDDALRICDGDANHPRFYKMIRGFPRSISSNYQVVLDPAIAINMGVTGPLPAGTRVPLGKAAGVDPSWSMDGDDAIFSGVEVVSVDGRVFLDFTGKTRKLPITDINDGLDPVTLQLRRRVIECIQNDGGPLVRNLGVDTSGNQGLADDIDIFVGAGCLHLNNGQRASENPLRIRDTRKCCDHIKDRGTEAWSVLAEFCKAGQVRGLSPAAMSALTRRRFVCRPGSTAPVYPLTMEKKEVFRAREKYGSPNEADACAIAALIVKERLGFLPFGAYSDVPKQLDDAISSTTIVTSPGRSLFKNATRRPQTSFNGEFV